jgi:hypothetical protein
MAYAPRPAPMPGWHSSAHIPMGYNMQFPNQYVGIFFSYFIVSFYPIEALNHDFK